MKEEVGHSRSCNSCYPQQPMGSNFHVTVTVTGLWLESELSKQNAKEGTTIIDSYKFLYYITKKLRLETLEGNDAAIFENETFFCKET